MNFDTTILIPTYNRSRDLRKLVHYLRNNFNISKVKVIVLDGSNSEEALANRRICNNASLEYKHYDSIVSYCERMLNGLNLVETDTVAILGDDDLLDPKGFGDCVKFLEDNPDYSVAHGQYVGFNLTSKGLSFNPTYQSSSIEGDSSLERLFSYFSSYTAPSFYAVNRTAPIIKSFEEVVNNNTDLKDYVSLEILISAIPLVNGKLKRLDSFYQARRFIPAPSDKYVTYAKYLLDEGFSERYNKVKRSIIKHIPDVDKIGMDTVSDALDFTFGALFGQRISTNEMRVRFNALNLSSP